MEIKLNNCNNITNCMVEIKENQLNIKYAINGSGKSTIAIAIKQGVDDRINGTQSIDILTPYKYLDSDVCKTKVEGMEHLKSVAIFNEEYVNSFVFQPNELLKSSNDIFIRDETYEAGLKEIEDHVDTLRKLFSEDQDIDELTKDLSELENSFGKQVKSGIHGSSAMFKAFSDGNKVRNIPKGLEEYKGFIQGNNSVKWVTWQTDGNDYLEDSDRCPYCVENILSKKDKIKKVGQEYDPKKIESLHRVISVFQRLDKYFSNSTKTEIDKLVVCIDGLTDDQQNYLVTVKEQIARLNRKFINAQRLGFDSLKDVDEVLEGLREHIIDVNLYPHLDSDSTREKADIVNDKINELLVKAGKLKGCIVKHKKHIEDLVKEHNDDINSFLRNAGYNYKVILDEDETGQYKLKLLDNEANLEVGNAKEHLSFGERNAFALVLFMYDALKKKPDLIILDDPISSFDNNKKYAIIDMLFSKGKAFRGKTVLMLTHDFEPLIDMLLHHTDRFELPFATFLENNNGELTEKVVMRNDVQTFIEITKANIDSDIHMINRLVYLRRLFEVTANKGCGYQLLSSLFHKRNNPTVRKDSNEREMTAGEIQSGHDEISEHIQGFDYKKLLLTVNDSNIMVQLYGASGNNYEKLHLYRILFDKDGGVESKIIRKFINEAFHLENDYIYQLNPSKYQLVPQYIIDECDKYIRSFD